MTITLPLLHSLINAPLLVGNLPEASTFPRHHLTLPDTTPDLNLHQKLGHLYEDALGLLLTNSPRYDLLAQNLQIQTDIHTTVGELDFLLRDLTSGQLIHLELATKFYLAVETDTGLTLPGPDARDNYFRKLTRLRTHQLQLPRLSQSHLPPEFRHQAIVTQQLIYGCLFDHIESTAPATPESLNPNCRRGKWLTIDHLLRHFPPDTTFQIIPKPLWPVPFELLQNIPLEPWSATPSIDRCLMLKADDHHSPYFITPPNYPAPGPT
ncbi:MAG: DUF1853 family protein [Akkermansiaceae bacterium]|jgi:hypothetical protein